MIDAKELRIGNLVRDNSIPLDIQIGLDEMVEFKEDPSLLSPIPLTEEWAVKFGHDNILAMASDFLFASNFFFKISVDELLELKVHQAQNLYYALTQTELTIKELNTK